LTIFGFIATATGIPKAATISDHLSDAGKLDGANYLLRGDDAAKLVLLLETTYELLQFGEPFAVNLHRTRHYCARRVPGAAVPSLPRLLNCSN
jgi:hypothetical protein